MGCCLLSTWAFRGNTRIFVLCEKAAFWGPRHQGIRILVTERVTTCRNLVSRSSVDRDFFGSERELARTRRCCCCVVGNRTGGGDVLFPVY